MNWYAVMQLNGWPFADRALAVSQLVKRSNNYSSRKQLVYAGKYRSDNKVYPYVIPFALLFNSCIASVSSCCHTDRN